MKKQVKSKGVKKKSLKKIRECHVKKRSMERFNLFLTRRDQEQIVRIIKEGKAMLLSKEGKHKSHYKIEYAGISMRVIYNSALDCLHTVIPLKNQQEKAI